MKILLFSKIKAVAIVSGETVVLGQTEPLKLSENQLVQVLVLENQALSFAFVAGEECEYIKTIQFETYKICEIFSCPKLFSPRIFLNKPIQNGSACLLGSPLCFLVTQNGQTYSQRLTEDISNPEITDAKHTVFLNASVDNQQMFLAFHKTAKTFLKFVGSVEFGESSIRAITNSKTLAGHGQMLNYDITADGFTLTAKEAVYIGKCPRLVPPFLTHIAFFEAVRENDFLLAKTYLTTSFAEKLSQEHLKQFFGEFDSIKVLNNGGKTLVALINQQTPNFATARTYCLTFENGKIADIQED